MKTRGPGSLLRSAPWITWCSSGSPTSRACSWICVPTFTRKAPTTPRKPFPSGPQRPAWASAWPSSAIPKTTRREICSTPFARSRMPEPRLLVVRLGSLGDIVHAFPAVASLRNSFPNSELVWVTHPRWKPLVESSALTSLVWTIETRTLSSIRGVVRQIRGARWDAAIDYQGLWKSAALPFLGGIKRRIGFSWETIREYGVPVLYTERVRSTAAHIADQNGELSLRAGARDPVASFRLNVSQEDEAAVLAELQKSGLGRYLVLSPGGGWRSKCWPPERFGSLCRLIHDSLGLRSIINYGPGEDELVAAIRTTCGSADPLPYNGPL